MKKDYRAIYESYGSLGGLSSPSRAKYRSIKQNVLPHLTGRVREVGSGQGELLQACLESGIEARGCDVSPEMVAACQSRGLAVDRVTDTVAFLRTCDAWETLVLVDVLEHLTRNEALEVARIARQRGKRIVIQVPNMASPFATLNFYHDLTHEWAYTEASIAQLLHLAGFLNVKVFAVQHPLVGLQRVRALARQVFYVLLWPILVIDQPNRSRVLTPNLLAVADISHSEKR